jgi:hypothetical protein
MLNTQVTIIRRSTTRSSARRAGACTLDGIGPARDNGIVDVVVAAATLWGLVSMSLILPVLHASTVVTRTAVGLLGAEFVMLLSWSYGSETCDASCPAGTSLAHTAAFEDIPALTAVLLVAATVEGRRAWRRDRGARGTGKGAPLCQLPSLASDDPPSQTRR